MFSSSKVISYQSKSKESKLDYIEYKPDGNTICLKALDGQIKSFTKEGKPHFIPNTGEDVVEVSGNATDGKQDISWAIATFEVGGHSTRHHHNKRTEVYYITLGKANVVVDGKEHILSEGDVITILPGQIHQVFNNDSNMKMELVVSCEPSWVFEDVIADNLTQTAAHKC